ncbi:MAG: hypothetical protein ACKVTZ_20680, partial [Bacteroidia bacterium]
MLNRKAIIFFLLAVASLLLGGLANLYFNRLHSPNAITEPISNRLFNEIKKAEAEAELLLSKNTDSVWRNLRYSFFLYDSSSVIKWNKNDYLPDFRFLQEDFKVKFLQSSRGSFVIRKWKLKGDSTLISCIPLIEKYSITNRYLVPSWNVQIFSGDGLELMEAVSPEGFPVKYNGIILFKVKFSSSTQDQYLDSDTVSLLFGWLALVFVTLGLSFIVVDFHKRRNFTVAFFILLAGLVLIRYVMIIFNFPRDYSTLFIFDPLQFASSSLNPSIADLFFNTVSVLLLGFYFFYTYSQWFLIREIYKMNSSYRFLFAVSLLLISFYTILFPFFFFETISHNSSISLDISQTINFDLTRSLAFLSIVLGSVCAFLFCHASFKIATLSVRHSRLQFFLALLVASLIFLLMYKISGRNYLITLISGLVFFSVLYIVDWGSSLKRFSYTTFLYFFLSIIVLSVQGSLSIRRFVQEKTIEDQFRYGSNFLVDRDILGEYLLNEAAKRISSDPFIQSRMATPFLAKSGVRQKVYQVYLNAYFDRYDVQVYLYNASGEPHDNIARLNFADLINEFQKEANKTNYEGVYFIESTNLEAAKRYLTIVPIEQYGSSQSKKTDGFGGQAGFVVLDLSLKKLIPQNVFPELLVDNQFFNYYKNADFSYAFFLKETLVGSSGAYNYERDFNPELLGKGSLYKTRVAE